jgi:hypothetical protein
VVRDTYQDYAVTANDVANRFQCNPSTVRNWAAKNGVKRTLAAGGIMAFDFTEDDCERFAARKKPGWKKGKARK